MNPESTQHAPVTEAHRKLQLEVVYASDQCLGTGAQLIADSEARAVQEQRKEYSKATNDFSQMLEKVGRERHAAVRCAEAAEAELGRVRETLHPKLFECQAERDTLHAQVVALRGVLAKIAFLSVPQRDPGGFIGGTVIASDKQFDAIRILATAFVPSATSP